MAETVYLTINVRYLPEWGTKDGLRELVQNWLDAADLAEGPPTPPDFQYGRLILSNPGSSLGREVLLMGVTSKAGVPGQRGCFGEGLKIGALALCRAGKRVEVRTSTERWTASIQPSPVFGCDVLTWTITPCVSDGVVVIVDELTQEEWDEVKSLFRTLADVPGPCTDVMLDGAIFPEAPGRVYVKGIMVESRSDLAYGYDFAHAAVDRDRRMVDHFDLRYHAGRLIEAALIQGVITADSVLDALLQARVDADHFDQRERDTRRMVADAFLARFGEGMIPCSGATDIQSMVSHGRSAVLVPSKLVDVIGEFTGTAQSVREDAKRDVLRIVDDLTPEEGDTLEWAIVHAAVGMEIDREALTARVVVVEYNDRDILGACRARSQIELARHVLSDRIETLATLIHEAAHFAASDGQRLHAAYIERAWSVLARLWICKPATQDAVGPL